MSYIHSTGLSLQIFQYGFKWMAVLQRTLVILVVNLHSCWFASNYRSAWLSMKLNGGKIYWLTLKTCWMLMADVNSAGSLSPRWTSSSPALLWGIRPPPTSEAETGLRVILKDSAFSCNIFIWDWMLPELCSLLSHLILSNFYGFFCKTFIVRLIYSMSIK